MKQLIVDKCGEKTYSYFNCFIETQTGSFPVDFTRYFAKGWAAASEGWAFCSPLVPQADGMQPAAIASSDWPRGCKSRSWCSSSSRTAPAAPAHCRRYPRSPWLRACGFRGRSFSLLPRCTIS